MFVICRGAIKLELPCYKNTAHNGVIITADPEPNWNLDSLLSELNSLELKLNGTSSTSSSASNLIVPFTKKQVHSKKVVSRSSHRQRGFVMRVSEDDDYDYDDDGVNDRELVTTGRRFSFTDSSDSESSGDDDSVIEENQMQLMGRVGLLDGVLAELEHERHQEIKEKVRNKVKSLETDLMHVYERSASALSQVEKDRDHKREQDSKIDMHHCRTVAEKRENHLLKVQRDHEQKSQIEERKIQNAAAYEEARRKEQAFREEKMRQEKAKAESEAMKKRAEEARKAAAFEAENQRAKEAAEKEVAENAKKASEEAQKREAAQTLKDVNRSEPGRSGSNISPSAGSLVRAADSALRVEVERLQKFKEVDENNQAFRSSHNQDFRSHELQIGRRIKQISGNRDSVRAKASELIRLINDPLCPQSISAVMFAKKVVSQCSTQSANFNSTAFACGHVIVLVTSQVPLAMDLLLAELHKACIYTVPKHVAYSESAISKEDYFKVMGFREEDGKVESRESYLEGVASYMKLYGALVQTEVSGVQNLHGLKEGWAWIARLLNSLPANIYTAVALNSFLEMAGFALFKTYKTQFRKILDIISRHFLGALESKQNPKLNPIIMKLKTYIDTNQFLKEPEGWLLKTSLLSEMAMPEANYSPQQNYHSQQNYYPQQNRQYRNY
ncbi:hypothetical protein MKX03_027460 [Papaver bracteatum]|nr:hypothetical protein MKX03_027460 [Papaver bracteatum]